MPILHHILSGWCVGAFVARTPRERVACMAAASLADLDGLGVFWSRGLYEQYHHTIGHNLFYGLLLAGLLGQWLVRRPRRGILFVWMVALFHLHLVMDYYGSGYGWGLRYLWPINDHLWMNPSSWVYGGPESQLALLALLLCGLIGVWRCEHTPFECLTPSLDADVHQWLQKKKGRGAVE